MKLFLVQLLAEVAILIGMADTSQGQDYVYRVVRPARPAKVKVYATYPSYGYVAPVVSAPVAASYSYAYPAAYGYSYAAPVAYPGTYGYYGYGTPAWGSYGAWAAPPASRGVGFNIGFSW
jgi:hypothetical protein